MSIYIYKYSQNIQKALISKKKLTISSEYPKYAYYIINLYGYPAFCKVLSGFVIELLRLVTVGTCRPDTTLLALSRGLPTKRIT